MPNNRIAELREKIRNGDLHPESKFMLTDAECDAMLRGLDAPRVVALRALNASPLFVGQNYAECTVCNRNKKPFGRSAPLESSNGYCDSDCEGYGKPPHASSLWPGERREDFGFPEELAKFAADLRAIIDNPGDTDDK